MAEPSQPVEEVVIISTEKENLVVGQIRFGYNPELEGFDKMVERFDNYWNELRNRIIRKITNHEGLNVTYEE